MYGPIMGKDSNGNDIPVTKEVNVIKLRESACSDTQLIAKISQGREGIKIEMSEKQKALDFLEKYFLANPMDQHTIDFDKNRQLFEERRLVLEEQRQNGDPNKIAEIVTQVQAIADLINHPVIERRLDDFMAGGECGDPVRTVDAETD
jgi:phage terminase small subunit